MTAAAARANPALTPFAIGVLAALSALSALSIDMYLPAMPAIARDLSAPAAEVQWSLSLFFAGFSLGQLGWGPLSDRVGRRAPVAAGLLLYVAAGALCAVARSAPELALLRLVQALGASAGPVLARAMVSDLADREGAAHVLSTLIVAMGIAPLLAPAVGAQLLALAGWRSIFWLLAALGVAILVAARGLGETLPASRRGGGASVARDYLALLGRPAFVAPALAAAGVYGGMFTYITSSPFVLITGAGLTPARYTAVFASNVAGLVAAAAVNRRLVPRVGARRMLVRGVWVTLAAGAALLAVAASGAGPWWALLPPLFCFIASTGVVAPNGFAVALSAAGRAGGAASALAGCVQFAIAAGAGAFVSLFDNRSPLPMAATMAALAAFTGGAAWWTTVATRDD